MFETRMATEADSELITEQRRKMFVEMGQPDDDRMQAMLRNFVPWVWERLKDGRYIGWLVEEEGGQIVAGAGMFLMDFPPNKRDPEPLRAYLLNFYVAPVARGRGLADGLLKTAIDEAKRRGIKVVSLHASQFGRLLYERNGFEATNEMMLHLDSGAVR
jgi:GNAT superfamily N-acetyltransferase